MICKRTSSTMYAWFPLANTPHVKDSLSIVLLNLSPGFLKNGQFHTYSTVTRDTQRNFVKNQRSRTSWIINFVWPYRLFLAGAGPACVCIAHTHMMYTHVICGKKWRSYISHVAMLHKSRSYATQVLTMQIQCSTNHFVMDDAVG